MGLLAHSRLCSAVEIEYAAPEMMALANLLAHPAIGPERMESAGSGKGLLRSAKDLGRVLALAWLAGREETENWPSRWWNGLWTCFSQQASELARNAGAGLIALLNDPSALKEARITTEDGLLNGKGVGIDQLRATAERLQVDVVEPLANLAAAPPEQDSAS